MIEAAKTVKDASLMLDPQRPALDPKRAAEFKHYYIQRGHTESNLSTAIQRAAQEKTKFNWFYTGHTGSGKSTELNRILSFPEVKDNFNSFYINLVDEYGQGMPVFSDIILSMAKAATKTKGIKIKKEMVEFIGNFTKEVLTENSIVTETKGRAGVKVSIPFVKLGEEIKSGGMKSKIIRDKMYNDITQFIRLIDETTDAIQASTGKQVLFIIDGLDHFDFDPCFKMFNDHLNTLLRPKASSLYVIPLALVNTPLAATIQGNYSILPNIKVYQNPALKDLDGQGLEFYKKLVGGYAEMELFESGVMESLFELSAGILRDMIRHTGNACIYAAAENKEKVEMIHVEKVWDEEKAFFRRILSSSDFEVLKKIQSEPCPKGLDGVSNLIFRKAIIYYPNGEGWYGVHPAIQKILS